jgi:hypothetical protein
MGKKDSKSIDSKSIDSKSIDSKSIDSKSIDSKSIDSKSMNAKLINSQLINSQLINNQVALRQKHLTTRNLNGLIFIPRKGLLTQKKSIIDKKLLNEISIEDILDIFIYTSHKKEKQRLIIVKDTFTISPYLASFLTISDQIWSNNPTIFYVLRTIQLLFVFQSLIESSKIKNNDLNIIKILYSTMGIIINNLEVR